MHKSYLEFGYCVEDLLFRGLSVHTVGGMVGVCVCVAFFTFLYEGVKTMRQRFASSLYKKHNNGTHRPAEDYQSEKDMLVEVNKTSSSCVRMKAHATQAFLYMMQVTMGYMLMLIIMSYNAWLAITVFASAGISYYVFSTFVLYRPSVIPIEILAPEESSH